MLDLEVLDHRLRKVEEELKRVVRICLEIQQEIIRLKRSSAPKGAAR